MIIQEAPHQESKKSDGIKPPIRAAYTVAEFAQLFGRSKIWAYRRIYSGAVKVSKIDGITLIPASEVARISEGQLYQGKG